MLKFKKTQANKNELAVLVGGDVHTMVKIPEFTVNIHSLSQGKSGNLVGVYLGKGWSQGRVGIRKGPE